MNEHPATVDWGKPYGRTVFRLPDGRTARLYRKGVRCRWYDEATGGQVGVEESNVFPAIVGAFARGWWDDSAPADLNVGCILEVRRNTKGATSND